MVKVEPSPGVLSTVTSPPIIRANRRLIARPSPVPPYFRVVEASACENASNSLAICAGVIRCRVGHPEDHRLDAVLCRSRRRRQGDGAVVGELAGVGQQVEEHLPHFGQVGMQAAERPGNKELEPVGVLVHQRLDGGGHLPEHLRGVELLEVQLGLAGLDLGEVEDIVIRASRCRPADRIFWRSAASSGWPISPTSSSSISL